MTIKQFRDKPIPKFDFEIMKDNHVLVQVYFHESEIITPDKSMPTEIKNIFRVLLDEGEYKVGDIVSLEDSLVEPPITNWKNPEGNDPNKQARPVYGPPLSNLQTFSFDCDKTGEGERLRLTFLVPKEFIVIKHSNIK